MKTKLCNWVFMDVWSRYRGWTPFRSKKFLSSPRCLTGILSPSVNRPGREDDHPPLSSADLRKEWSYISTPPCLARDNLHLLYLPSPQRPLINHCRQTLAEVSNDSLKICSSSSCSFLIKLLYPVNVIEVILLRTVDIADSYAKTASLWTVTNCSRADGCRSFGGTKLHSVTVAEDRNRNRATTLHNTAVSRPDLQTDNNQYSKDCCPLMHFFY